MSRKFYNIGVVGAGMIARQHLEHFFNVLDGEEQPVISLELAKKNTWILS